MVDQRDDMVQERVYSYTIVGVDDFRLLSHAHDHMRALTGIVNVTGDSDCDIRATNRTRM